MMTSGSPRTGLRVGWWWAAGGRRAGRLEGVQLLTSFSLKTMYALARNMAALSSRWSRRARYVVT